MGAVFMQPSNLRELKGENNTGRFGYNYISHIQSDGGNIGGKSARSLNRLQMD
jgi:hypothetical protein